jgi:hypothetical protein
MYQGRLKEWSKKEKSSCSAAARDARARSAARRFWKSKRGIIMLPLEHYWPPEMLVQVFPDKYRHLVEPVPIAFPKAAKQRRTDSRYRAEHRGNCTIYWLGRGGRWNSTD